jgi:DNA-binding IclR family transcriptional regulator
MGAVARAFGVLDLLSRSPAPLGTSEIARRLGIPKSTAHGLLRELAAVGAVEAARKRYRLGPALERLAGAAELRRQWRPVLEQVAERTGETAFLGQPRGARIAILDEVPGSGVPSVSAPVGSSLPASAGAVGKVLAGAAVAEDHGEYLPGVNAAAAAVPGGVIWVAGFAARLDAERLADAARLLRALTGERL